MKRQVVFRLETKSIEFSVYSDREWDLYGRLLIAMSRGVEAVGGETVVKTFPEPVEVKL